MKELLEAFRDKKHLQKCSFFDAKNRFRVTHEPNDFLVADKIGAKIAWNPCRIDFCGSVSSNDDLLNTLSVPQCSDITNVVSTMIVVAKHLGMANLASNHLCEFEFIFQSHF